jgi:hypothetical protein
MAVTKLPLDKMRLYLEASINFLDVCPVAGQCLKAGCYSHENVYVLSICSIAKQSVGLSHKQSG